MISDVLFEAAEQIEEYLADCDEYAGPGIREAIEELVRHMNRVRRLPGLDTPPDDEQLKRALLEIKLMYGAKTRVPLPSLQ
jgi:hypothetical protein